MRLLIVDDEVPQMRALCDTLNAEGFSTTGYASAAEALAAIRPDTFDLILTDLMMPGTDGIAFLEAARAVDPHVVGIVMTGHGAIDTAVRAMQAGAIDYILKPFKLNAVLPVLTRAFAIHQLRVANAKLERHLLERTYELEVANRALEAANKDLESFSYSVSHDLRAPLHTVSGFLDIYLTDHAASISDDGRTLLQHAVDGTKRMRLLIEALLRFAHVGWQPLTTGTVSVDEIVRRIVGELLRQHADREIEVDVGQLGECDGDASLIEQVFINLISNAFKFTGGRHPARIDVGCRAESQELVYFVRDNGAGFDSAYAHKLFGVFQRLHSTAEFDGTGVGLSIVRRIVQRHGGRVWAEGEPGRGATFYCSFRHATE